MSVPAAPRDSRAELAALFARRFPLAAALGLRVAEASPLRVRLACPLEPNLNRMGTAFGGSLYSAATLSGWGLLWCVLKERRLADADIVVADSGERYLVPVGEPFIAECCAPVGAFDVGLATLRRRDRARVETTSEVLCRGRVCAVFRATYALLRKTPGNIVAETNLLDRTGV